MILTDCVQLTYWKVTGNAGQRGVPGRKEEHTVPPQAVMYGFAESSVGLEGSLPSVISLESQETHASQGSDTELEFDPVSVSPAQCDSSLTSNRGLQPTRALHKMALMLFRPKDQDSLVIERRNLWARSLK